MTSVSDAVREYYGQALQSNRDLKTSACACSDDLSPRLKGLAGKIHPEVLDRFYGCGSPIPPVLEGCRVIDLGCGTGRDAFLLSAEVGARGWVTGVDITEEQLAVAWRHQAYHRDQFGLPQINTEFVLGPIDDLGSIDIPAKHYDVAVSNCAINLAEDKAAVFAEIRRVLKPGGELLFSDVFASRRVPGHLRADPTLLGECLAGAMYLEDFRRIMANIGWLDIRVVAKSPIRIEDASLREQLGPIEFTSITVRAFRLDLEDRCEDYGQVATYLGTMPQHPVGYRLDAHHYFERAKPTLVCGNTASMLTDTRLAPFFRVDGDRETHFGLFPCGDGGVNSGSSDATAGCC